jgi:hypothetical protein
MANLEGPTRSGGKESVETAVSKAANAEVA